MDDIAFIASSKSFKKNIKILEREANNLIKLGEEYLISFNIEKTELIYFYRTKNTPSLTLPNKTILAPSKLVKWLGVYFDSNLKFKDYRLIRTSLAKVSFYRINRLLNITIGLSPFIIR